MNELDRIRLAAGRASHLASRIASRVQEPQETIAQGLDAARAAIGCDAVILTLLDPAGTTLSVFESTDASLRSLRLPASGLAGAITQWNRGEVVPDIASDPRRDELSAKCGMRRFVCSPVRMNAIPRGTLLAAARTPGATPSDASDLLVLGLFADLMAIALGELEERRATQAFHEKLSQLAARSFDRWLGDELDPALQAVARERGLALDGADCDPILPEIARTVRATAAVLSAPDAAGTWRVADSWGLDPHLAQSWAESSDEVRRAHRDGRFSCVAAAASFGPFDQDLRVLLRAPDGARVLHLLARSSRGPFGPRDLRCAEMAAVRIGWSLHATALEAKPVPEEISPLIEIPEAALEPLESAA